MDCVGCYDFGTVQTRYFRYFYNGVGVTLWRQGTLQWFGYIAERCLRQFLPLFTLLSELVASQAEGILC
jgi:hypothetical protein